MTLSEHEAVEKAAEYLELYKPVGKSDYELSRTYNAKGRWKIKFKTPGLDRSKVTVRLDDQTGNLASEEGHSKTSKGLK
jgi:hypothetical protein